MRLRLFYPRWGSADIPWPVFLKKIKGAGYEGVELGFSLVAKENRELRAMLADFDLQHVGQHWQTKEVHFEKHKEAYKRHLYNLVDTEPLLINSHTGMDFFSFAQNAELIELAENIAQETGVTITHETHRSRFAYAAHVCYRYLQEFPFIKLTADFAHWTCVAESLLENQEDILAKCIAHTYHLHMRVGSSQSSQVQDPSDSNYHNELERFIQWWMAILLKAVEAKRSHFTLVPEHGPFPYGLYRENTRTPMTDQWQSNTFIRNTILAEWKKRSFVD